MNGSNRAQLLEQSSEFKLCKKHSGAAKGFLFLTVYRLEGDEVMK